MSWKNTTDHYGSLSIGMHWLMLALLIGVYACIELRGFFPRGSDLREGLKTWHFMLGLSVFALWNLATLVGALGAGVVDVEALGLDAAVGAAFLGLLVLQARDRTAVGVAVAGAAVAALAVPLTPPGQTARGRNWKCPPQAGSGASTPREVDATKPKRE